MARLGFLLRVAPKYVDGPTASTQLDAFVTGIDYHLRCKIRIDPLTVVTSRAWPEREVCRFTIEAPCDEAMILEAWEAAMRISGLLAERCDAVV